ncbi:imidazole glycerol phosphate synthase subunit HisH [Liquorilactobacillus mali]|uniref:Imidazole glycerol phosphate synthase subunit HisH n=1 Tax=Liquorilactobacillus mali KCTC 3596 = DSM 20444 TaxID=1046596 RepID=J1F583_9LACO|nr:imidazole glycerol phosphate synthase subunit HisH [Liquorilactobacillus mali]EJF01441.1 imidazole glycerol phosphate synthase subunit HisH [Liquorilactobacillus mali KCTC 3596 = DSM 20444]KRN10100.1 imidazole glycerol phosphate synthase subunit HisH [Liquorilactobacillus mali KCTC 3596 = DSM 20444]MDC7953855.1 imidazole glycerol phosphate synthase subunit HisH [Liquorilactobacillus mali]QFQ75200.1 imidazole glycerol phosphate synthase subunit HisH [Liquorilactobacillus mali]
MLSIIDYDAGNTFNVIKAFKYLGIEVQLTDNPEKIMRSSGLILPGVGAFGPAMETLEKKNLIGVIKEAVLINKIPLLGICLGMQMLFEKSSEYGNHKGLGLIPGEISAIPEKSGLKVPQMGWNENHLKKDETDFEFIANEYTYFVHSYYAVCDKKYLISTVDYGVEIPAMVQSKNVFGTQFHPEKSGKVGLNILKTFSEKVVK